MFFKVLSLLWLVYGAPIGQIMSSYWFHQNNDQRLIRSAVLAANTDRGLVAQLQAKALSKKIIHISQCFEIDPILFTALVWRESHFRQQSKSETGAVGLTQLTTSGIHEVLDRLSADSRRKKDQLRQQLAKCYPRTLKTIPRQIEQVDFSSWKKKIAGSPELALIFGAVLFKSYQSGEVRIALERYNGDPKVKVKFANDVLALSYWIKSSFKVIPEIPGGNSKFLASIQDL